MIRRSLAALALGLLATMWAPATPAANAATAAAVLGSGTWANPMGADSSCVVISGTTVACSHTADSATHSTESCAEPMQVTPGVTVLIACHAHLNASTSGTGKQVSGGIFACSTLGIMSGTLSFSDALFGAYPPVPVTIVNNGGTAKFFGELLNADGSVAATTSGTFTLACGSTETLHGAFSGSYDLV
jgi:hypothetical protein